MVSVHFVTAIAVAGLVAGQQSCPGYQAVNVQQTNTGMTADLTLGGQACNVYGSDVQNLTLTVDYQTGESCPNIERLVLIRTDTRLHVLIEDQNQTVYQVPGNILPRPSGGGSSSTNSQLLFNFTENPFGFAVTRPDGEVLFNTSGSPLVFESQYLNLRTALPANPNLYGLGEHTDPLRLNTTNYTRTIWARDAYGVPSGTNLYGNHPIYLEHRGSTGSHAVIFVNSNGMDIKINDTAGQYLEYNTLGGVFDFYFVAGPSPVDVVQQISEVVGRPAMIPYAGLGYHNCRYGYQDVYEVAEVVHNYSAANIPLETMWTDIDYMDLRQVFTLDPDRFPLEKVRELVDYLHAHQQHYVMMVDPAIAYQNYTPFNEGRDMDVLLKSSNGSIYQAVVWAGVSAYPDWFHPDTQTFWDNRFTSFFNGDTGVDIDFLWIDMNEPSNFCNYPCSDALGFALESGDPPPPPALRSGPAIPLPGFPPDFQPGQANTTDQLSKRQSSSTGSMQGLPGRNLTDPPYTINNAAGVLSNKTADTDLTHYNGLAEYDTHNLFGTMMSNASRHAMEQRRPGLRPMVITRSTFLGAGTYVGHWLGDNLSDWPHYRISIAQMLQFTSIFQIPMVGSDVCGFGDNTTETLCARWMMLGAFSPFYRNHNNYGSIPQEAYRWDSVAAAARYAIDIRYRLMDYLYTAIWTQTQNGIPVLNPVFYLYPSDENTFAIQEQFFFGDAVLVSPVTEENGTSVTFYLPNDIFYDWNSGFAPVSGSGNNITLNDVGFQTIPLHVRGGTILPLRAQSANTTTELRKNGFNLVIAPGNDGTARGVLYLDEGSMLSQPNTSVINMTFINNTLSMRGSYGYPSNVSIEAVTLLGATSNPSGIQLHGGNAPQYTYNSTTKVVSVTTSLSMTEDFTMTFATTLVGGSNSTNSSSGSGGHENGGPSMSDRLIPGFGLSGVITTAFAVYVLHLL